MSVGRKLVVRLTHSKLHHLPSQATVQCQQGIFFIASFFFLLLFSFLLFLACCYTKYLKSSFTSNTSFRPHSSRQTFLVKCEGVVNLPSTVWVFFFSQSTYMRHFCNPKPCCKCLNSGCQIVWGRKNHNQLFWATHCGQISTWSNSKAGPCLFLEPTLCFVLPAQLPL